MFDPLIVRGLPIDPQTRVGWYGSVHQGLMPPYGGGGGWPDYPNRPRTLPGCRGTGPAPDLPLPPMISGVQNLEPLR